MTSFTGRGADGHVDQLIAAYALDALDDLERATVERHLAGCESCSAEAAELAETAALLGAAEETPPPPALRERVLGAARSTPQLPPRVPVRRPLAVRRLAAVAAAIVVLAGAVGTTWWVQENRIADEHAQVVAAQQENARLQAVMSAPDAHAVAAGSLSAGQITAVYSAARRAAVLTFGGLAPTPAGKTYQLWRIDGTVATTLGALPAGVRSGTAYVDGLAPADELAVSIEDDGGVASPTDVIARMAMA